MTATGIGKFGFPTDSTCDRLLASALRAGIPIAVLIEILRLLNLPLERLQGLLGVCRGIDRFVSEALRVAPRRAKLMRLKSWTSVINWLSTNAESIAEALFSPDSPDDKELFLRIEGSNPIRNAGTKRYAAAYTLWQLGSDPQENPRILSLNAVALMSHCLIFRAEVTLTIWKNGGEPAVGFYAESLYKPLFYARQLAWPAAEAQHWNAALNLLPKSLELSEAPGVFRRAATLVDALRREGQVAGTPNSVEKDIANGFIRLEGFVNWAIRPDDHSRRKWTLDTPRKYKGRRVPDDGGAVPLDKEPEEDDHQRESACEPFDQDDDVHFDSAEDQTSASLGSICVHIPTRWLRDRAAYDELLAAGVDPHERLASSDLQLARDERSRAAVQRGWSELAAQRLQIDAALPSHIEAARLLRAASDKTGEDWREWFALLNTVYFRGMTLIEALNLKVGTEATAFSSQDFGLILSGPSSPSKPYWQVPVLPLAIDPEHYRHADPQYNFVDVLELPDVAQVRRAISASIPVAQDRAVLSGWSTPRAIFQHEPSWYDSRLEELQQNGGFPRRLTFAMLARVMPQITYAMSDSVASSYLSGKPDWLAKSRRFYPVIQVSYLQKIYSEATCRLSAQLNRAGFHHTCDLQYTPSPATMVVGSPFSPSLLSLANGVSWLRTAFQDSVLPLWLRHNYFVLYGLLFVSLIGAASRAVISPYVVTGAFDDDNNCATTDDKGRDKARLLVSTQESREQAGYLEDHCRKLARRRGLGRSWERLGCYLLSDQFVPATIRPKTIEPLLDQVFSLPVMNFGRHFMASALRAYCGSETWDAFLGHGFRGENFFEPHSCLHPHRYLDKIQHALNQIFRDIGLEALPFEEFPSDGTIAKKRV